MVNKYRNLIEWCKIKFEKQVNRIRLEESVEDFKEAEKELLNEIYQLKVGKYRENVKTERKERKNT